MRSQNTVKSRVRLDWKGPFEQKIQRLTGFSGFKLDWAPELSWTGFTSTLFFKTRLGELAGQLLLAATLILGCALAAQAADGKRSFDIKEQPLAQALMEFGAQSGLTVAAHSVLTAGKTAVPLHGEMSVADALAKLLAGSGLTFTIGEDGTVAVHSAQSRVPPIASAAQPQTGVMKPVQPNDGESDLNSDSTNALGLEEIIVTAQRREERLQDIPISIGVLSGDELERSSARGVSAALAQVGGVSLVERQPGKSAIAIRGVLGESNGSSGAPTAGNYLDEVPFVFNTRAEVPDMNAFDLSRVEVLRGPQGTLYGVNALSGVVRVLTNDAVLDEFEFKGRVRAASTDEGGDSYNGDVALNVPLIDGKLAVRGVASYSQLGGYVDSIPSAKKDINDTEAQSYRLKMTYQPSENLSVKLGMSRSDIDNGAPSTSNEDLLTGNTTDQYDRRVYDTYNLVVEYRWSAVSLLSSTSYLDYHVDTLTQLTAGVPSTEYLSSIAMNSFSQEFRLVSMGEGPWQWSAGAFYRDATETQFDELRFLFPSPFEIEPVSESYAIFGELSRSFADGRFEVVGGVRYFEDDIVKTNTQNFNPAALAPTDHQTYDRVTGRLVLNYKPSTDQTLYASVATGFRTGLARDAAILSAGVNLPAAHPDDLINYELGVKGSLADGAFTYDAAAYYMEWEDIVQSLSVLGQTLNGPTYFSASTNGGTASGPGFDGSIAYHPTSALTLLAAVGWNDLKYNDDVYSRGILLFPEGGRVNFSPEWTGSLGGSYRLVTPKAGLEAVFYAGAAYRSEVLTRNLAAAVVTMESSYELSSNVSIGLEADRWSVQLYGDNILDKREQVMPAASPGNRVYGALYQRPRTIGLQASFRY